MANGNDPGATSPVMQTDQGPAVYMGTAPPPSTSQALNTLYGMTGLPYIQAGRQAFHPNLP